MHFKHIWTQRADDDDDDDDDDNNNNNNNQATDHVWARNGCVVSFTLRPLFTSEKIDQIMHWRGDGVRPQTACMQQWLKGQSVCSYNSQFLHQLSYQKSANI